MVLFGNGNFFNVLKKCKRPTIRVPERAIIPYFDAASVKIISVKSL